MPDKQIIQFVFPDKIDIHVHVDGYDHLTPKINEILKFSIDNNLKTNKIMATLDEVLAGVAQETTLDDSIIALLTGIKTQLEEALSGENLSPAAQAKVDAVFAAVSANNAKVAAAIEANTTTEGGGEGE